LANARKVNLVFERLSRLVFPRQVPILAGLHFIDGPLYSGAVALDLGPVCCGENQDRQISICKILLVAEVLIGGDEDVEFWLGSL
jgi:hypothetical protein